MTEQRKTHAHWDLIDKHAKQVVRVLTPEELALGWMRYEALRRLNPRQFSEIHDRNIRGEWFDDLADEAFVRWKEGQV